MRLQNSCFRMKFAELLRIPILKNINERLVLKGLFSVLFYCESGINQHAVQRVLKNVSGASLLLFEPGCLRSILLLYHFRMLRVFMRISIKVLFKGLTVKYIFLATIDFCSSCITEEEINDLEKLLYLCYLVVLLREVTIHI